MFFAELEMIQSVVATLSSDAKLSALVADSTPDAFTFVFSSLKVQQILRNLIEAGFGCQIWTNFSSSYHSSCSPQ